MEAQRETTTPDQREPVLIPEALHGNLRTLRDARPLTETEMVYLKAIGDFVRMVNGVTIPPDYKYDDQLFAWVPPGYDSAAGSQELTAT